MLHLEGLNEPQKEAVLHTEGPLLIVAGAGAGKTKTIIHRIVNLLARGVPGNSILAVTFTNKAAQEMRDRIAHLKPPEASQPLFATFHALSVRILREFAAEAGLPRGFVIWDRDDSIRTIRGVLKAQGKGDTWTPRLILARISKEKGAGYTIKEARERIRHFRDEGVVEVWEGYEKEAQKEGAVDFDDLLLKTRILLDQREDIRHRLQERWRYLTIDEYQDTNAIQFEIARLLAGAHHNICVVGDVDQNIYSWRGADIAHLLGFEKQFPGARSILLEQNYRSTQTILTAANAVIAKNTRRFEKKLFTENPTGDAITLYGAPDEHAEARFVVERIRELLGSGVTPGEIAVLYRENFQSRVLEEACIQAGLPYRVLGTRFFERREVKDVLSYTRAALNPQSSSDLARIVSAPPRGIGKQTLEKMLAGEEGSLSGGARAKVDLFRALLLRIRHALETLPISQAVKFIITESGLERHFKEGDEEDRERLLNVYELVSLACIYDTLPPPEGAERLLEDAALMGEQDTLIERENAVSLMTVHASKGLEFEAVFVTGLEQGLFPALRDNDETRDSEEERRLFYVALTRAKRYAFLSYAQTRVKYGSREYALPSEFIDDIDPRLLKAEHPLPPREPRSRGLLDDYDIY